MAGSRPLVVILAALSCLPRGLAWYRELPSCLDEFQPFVQVGCFDNGEPGGLEALSMKTELFVTGMTVETCVAECKGNGFRYAGLAWYGNCYCGQTVDTAMLDAGQCSLPCDGNQTQACGGDAAVNIYQDPTFLAVGEATIDEYVALGCYSDGSSLGKALFYQQAMGDTSAVTTEACLAKCLAGGFPFAGTEYARECYCGVVLGNDTAATDPAECAMPCTGDAGQVCGGPDRLSLYVARDLQSLEPCGYEDVPGGNSSTTSSSVYATASSSSSSSDVSASSSLLQTSTPTSVTTTAYPSSYSASASSSTIPSSSASATPSPSLTHSATLATSVTRSSTTSSAALCTTTIITPPTCEYTCGKWCSSPLPDWADGAGCLTAWSSCAIQTAACFQGAGWPDAMDCFGFLEWCGGVQAYCGSACGKGGKCTGGKSDCLAGNPPRGGRPPSTSTSAYPCPTTVATSGAPSSGTSAASSYPVPTPTGACRQPSNAHHGYAPSSPVGGISLPAMTCNNLAAQHAAGAVLKLYTDSDSRRCAAYPRSGCATACADACRAQYDACQGTYAAGCLVDGWAGGKSYGQGGDRFGVESYDSASTRCMQQYLDCLSVNLGVSGEGKCVKFGDGW